MSSSTETTSTETEPAWVQAGKAWEHAALDWAFLFEQYARDAVEDVFGRANVGPGTELLDVACGSGLALGRAERLGAKTAGVDASAGLIEIAKRRAPESDARAGDMFDLPWADDSFDVVTSFNGIWGGCAAAVAEVARVVRGGGIVGFTFWGPGDSLDLRDYFIALGSTRHDVAEELIDLASIGHPGVAEAMLADAGLSCTERFASNARLEFPDAETAWRALRSPGVVLPPLQALGDDEIRRLTLDAIEQFRASDGSYILNNELTVVMATTA